MRRPPCPARVADPGRRLTSVHNTTIMDHIAIIQVQRTTSHLVPHFARLQVTPALAEYLTGLVTICQEQGLESVNVAGAQLDKAAGMIDAFTFSQVSLDDLDKDVKSPSIGALLTLNADGYFKIRSEVLRPKYEDNIAFETEEASVVDLHRMLRSEVAAEYIPASSEDELRLAEVIDRCLPYAKNLGIERYELRLLVEGLPNHVEAAAGNPNKLLALAAGWKFEQTSASFPAGFYALMPGHSEFIDDTGTCVVDGVVQEHYQNYLGFFDSQAECIDETAEHVRSGLRRDFPLLTLFEGAPLHAFLLAACRQRDDLHMPDIRRPSLVERQSN